MSFGQKSIPCSKKWNEINWRHVRFYQHYDNEKLANKILTSTKNKKTK